MKMQMHREFSFVAKSGLSWNFVPGVTIEIPQRHVMEAMQHGAFAVADSEAAGQAAQAELVAQRAALDERVPKIQAAIAKLIERNQRGDFTAGGRPNLNVLFRETGFQVTSEELDPIWNEIRREIA